MPVLPCICNYVPAISLSPQQSCLNNPSTIHTLPSSMNPRLSTTLTGLMTNLLKMSSIAQLMNTLVAPLLLTKNDSLFSNLVSPITILALPNFSSDLTNLLLSLHSLTSQLNSEVTSSDILNLALLTPYYFFPSLVQHGRFLFSPLQAENLSIH